MTRVLPYQTCCSAFYCSGFVVSCFTIPDLLFRILLFRVPTFRDLPQPEQNAGMDSFLEFYKKLFRMINLFCSKVSEDLLCRTSFIFLVNTLQSRIIGGVGILEGVGGLDIVIIINNRGGWNNRGDGRG